MDERKRDSIVAYLRRRMAELGIEPDDVAASIAADQEKLRAVRYRDASGNTWDGKSDAPRWVLQATSAGQSLEHFALSGTPESVSGKRASVDWAGDPFAGSRLATINTESLGVA
ncbi:H-NS family nucleoid-associated regulatory protein [Paraburkholderia sp. HD33-4]|uniref:H-NS family nucleoid-associated regulatory protein n=1 Tax=Paraburkholderia sp. HD33-4 TaxID=2883242 RepID=UPI001F444681|nr:H-NS family nucleoid-associated regulatory protein [Paraburkholderia sp. HD33-4]